MGVLQMKKLVLILALAGAVWAQPSYPTYVRKPKPTPSPGEEISRPAPRASSPSTVLPTGSLYQTQGGQIREVTGPGQSINAGTSGGRSTYSRTQGSGPPTVSAGSKITTSKIKTTPLDGGGSYPGQQP